MTTTESQRFTVLLGTATNDPSTVTSSSGKAVAAATKNDMTAARKGIPPASLEQLSVEVNASELSLYDPMELAGWVSCLQPGATVSVTVRVSPDAAADTMDFNAIHSSFLLAGLKGTSERREANGSRVFTASKPSALKKISNATGAKPISLAKKSAVSISLDDFGGDDDDDLIDEDGLLNDGTLAPPPAMEATANTDDCGGRTACDDCTCGRAEEEAGAKKKYASKNKASACGKCGMGDAFRCASCPYLGKPAFKPGEEPDTLVLDLQDDF